MTFHAFFNNSGDQRVGAPAWLRLARRLTLCACLLLVGTTVTVLRAQPAFLGDLDENGVADARDIARLVGHLGGTDVLPLDRVPYADVDGNGLVSTDDVTALMELVLEKREPASLVLGQLADSSPSNGETGIALNRKTEIDFSLPLADSVTLTSAEFYANFAGEKLPARIEISPDRLRATLFYSDPLPSSARIRVTLDGAGIVDTLGRPFDLDADGLAGGRAVIDFDTASITPVGDTAITGTVFASEQDAAGNDIPLQGVRIELVGAESETNTLTGPDGSFVLQPVPAGRFFVNIDGRPVTGNFPVGDYYPFVGKTWEAQAGRSDNLAGGTGRIYLPLVRAGSLQTVSETQSTEVTFVGDVIAENPELTGVSITIPAGALFSDDGARGGRVGIAPVAPDRLPEALPPGLDLPLVITIQTDGPTNFDTPVPVKFPNTPDPVTGEALPPGAKSALWSFNHGTGKWAIAGPMTVSADGKYVVSDPGVGVRQPGWHGQRPGTQGDGLPPAAPCNPAPPSEGNTCPAGHCGLFDYGYVKPSFGIGLATKEIASGGAAGVGLARGGSTAKSGTIQGKIIWNVAWRQLETRC